MDLSTSTDQTRFFQRWLDRVAAAFFENSFEVYRDAVILPLTVTTQKATMIVETEAELRQGFDAWADMLKAQQATDMIRTARSVEMMDDAMMFGVYDTEILAGARRVITPFTSFMLLRREDDVWRAATVTSGMSNESWPITVPKTGMNGQMN